MKQHWSNELRLMLRPASTYRQLVNASDDSGNWLMLRRPLFVAFVVGSFTSFTVSGHLTVWLLMDGMVFWSILIFSLVVTETIPLHRITSLS
jgi:hypothetical protein